MPRPPRKRNPPDRRDTSWQKSKGWFDRTVGEKGHHYHQTVVIPGVLKLLALEANSSLLDLGCGQGVLARAIPKSVAYHGVDSAPALIEEAKRLTPAPNRAWTKADASKRLPFEPKGFTHAAIVLALQNMENGRGAIDNAAAQLAPGGRLVVVLNHPCFRIPRQSSWSVDEKNGMQFRRIDRYATPMKIPIRMNPSLGDRSPTTWSFHAPLSDLFAWLAGAGFLVERLEEWHSGKTSEGKTARRENRARSEFPLFLALAARRAV